MKHVHEIITTFMLDFLGMTDFNKNNDAADCLLQLYVAKVQTDGDFLLSEIRVA